MFQQLSLFDSHSSFTPSHRSFEKQIQASGFKYQELDIGDITFKSGQTEPIHRWYRLTPSYSPNLVRFLIQELGIFQQHLVFDPFSGRGTTGIECQKQGIRTVGMEINPLLQQVGHKSLKWESENIDLFPDYLAEVAKLMDVFDAWNLEEVVEHLQTEIPIIHNVFRWWHKEVLKQLIVLRQTMVRPKFDSIQDYLWLALNETCLDCANIHRNHPTITFDDHRKTKVDVLSHMTENVNQIYWDLKHLSMESMSYSELGSIQLGNSMKGLKQQKIEFPVDFVITSPPYPNRYSYVHQTRPQLYFMELLNNTREATEIDLQAIGGTWGRATSILQKDLIEVPDAIRAYLYYYEELRSKSLLMCNYATKYFIDLWKHIIALKEVIKPEFRGVYIVGNSRLSGVDIFTESILGHIFEQEGFRIEQIVCFRKRGGKKNLYETALFIRT